MLALGQEAEARRMLTYLAATQSPDGHWKQNFYPDGAPYWTGVQLDEAGLPVLLAAKLLERDALDGMITTRSMVRRAASFLVRHGAVTPQDRWEENEGLSPFTLGIQAAALIAATQFLEDDQERALAESLADYLNERIEDWTYATGTDLCRKHGVDGYYVRIAPASRLLGDWGDITIPNRADGEVPAVSVVALDFLYLARLGLRSPDAPEIQRSLKVAEAELGVDTPSGRCYHRYTGDGYGEHDDGSPFDGTGRGRLWPLLTGERGHFALMCGENVSGYLQSMIQMSGRAGLIPEQIWDAAPIPEHWLEPGKPSGSAMPLLWAQAEFLKLVRAEKEGRPIELLEVVKRRYGGRSPSASVWHWREDMPFTGLPQGRSVLIESQKPFRLHFGFDGWQSVEERPAEPIGFGMFGVRLDPADLVHRSRVDFTWRDTDSGEWRNKDFSIALRE
jgi:glucoamylase